MAITLVRDGLRVQQWDAKFFREFVRENKFAPYMGANEAAIIQMKERAKSAGDSITFQMVGRLTNAGVRGANSLRGNEEQLNNRSQRVFVELVRNAVSVDVKTEQIKTDIDLRNAARATLKDWAMETMRNDVIAALMSIDGVTFANATTSQRNTWLTNNADRVLFGRALGTAVAGNHASSLSAVTNLMTMNAATVSLLKRRAKMASPRIRPVKTKGDEEWYVLFLNSLVFRDLKNDSTILTSNREAWVRGADNPIFTDGDLIYDGVIIREIEDIPSIPGVGGGSIALAPGFLCGAQAVGVGIAQRTRSVEDEPQDYGRIIGVGVEEIRGIQKLRFGTGANDTDTLKDFGVVTVWSPAVGDA
jgi:N4-gp56 family major capsid protein